MKIFTQFRVFVLVILTLFISQLSLAQQGADKKRREKEEKETYEKRERSEREDKEKYGEKKGTEADDEEMYEEMEHANEKNEYVQAHSSWYKQMIKEKPNLKKAERAFNKYFSKYPEADSKLKNRYETWKIPASLYQDKKGYSLSYPQMEGNFAAPAAPLVSSNKTFGTWTMIGPANMVKNQCGNNSRVTGGFVDRVYVNPYNTQNLLAGFSFGGLWVSKNQGASWQLTDGSFANGTNTYANRDYYYGEIEANKLNSDLVFAATEAGLLKSTDGGINWALSPQLNRSVSSTERPYYVATATDDQTTILSTFGRKLYRSTDGGNTWSIVFDNSTGGANHRFTNQYNKGTPFGLDDRNFNFFGLEANFNNANEFYLGAWNASNQACIFKSTDKGATFTLLVNLNTTLGTTWGSGASLCLKTIPSSPDKFMVYQQFASAKPCYKFSSAGALLSSGLINAYPEAFDIDWSNENTMYQGEYSPNYIQKSTDGGATFAKPYFPANGCNYVHADVRGISAVGNIVLIGNDGGLALSTDGGATVKGTGFEINSMNMGGFASSVKSDICLTGLDHNQTFVRSFEADGGWKEIKGADANLCSINPYLDRWLYYHWGYGVSRGYLNDNQTVTESSVALGLNMGSFQFDPYNPFIIYAISNSNNKTIVKSTDNMVSAALLYDFGETVNDIRVSRNDAKVLYVLLSGNKIKKTIDGGATWALVTPSSAQSGGQTNITAIEVGKTSNELWAAYGNAQNTAKVLYSTDGGSSWINITTNNLPAAAVNDIVYQRGTNGGVYIITVTSTGTKIWYKNNSMATWQQTGSTLPMMGYIKGRLYVVPAKNKIRFGSSRGAWENDLYETSAVEAGFVSEARISGCGAGPIQFYDASVAPPGAVTYAWQFPGGSPATSTLENPKVTYSTSGIYPVTLTTTTAAGTDTKTLDNFITVLECGSTIPVIADAYVQGGPTANNNYGTLSGLVLRQDAIVDWIREVYLKFDLASLPATANKVALRLNVASAQSNITSTTWQVYYVPADSWTETGLTWNNKPATSTLLGTIQGTATGSVEWDITPQALAELAGDKTLSLKIVSTVVASNNLATFSSREVANVNLRPQLTVGTINPAPTVGITSPADNSTIFSGSNLAINAYAGSASGTIANVDFYQGTTLLGTSTVAPYNFTWNNVPAGSHSLTAKATDNGGLVTTSTAINIIVNAAPTVSITSPANNAIFTEGENITINADAADADGTISKVEFYQGSTLLGQSTTAPFNVPFNNLLPGIYTITARATDNSDQTTNAAPVTLTVKDITPPVITSPANIIMDYDAANCGRVSYSISATDNCSATLNRTAGLGSDAVFPIGITTETYEAVDPSGNSTTVSFTVTVNKVPTTSTLTAPATVQYSDKPSFTARIASGSSACGNGAAVSATFKSGTEVLGTVSMTNDGADQMAVFNNKAFYDAPNTAKTVTVEFNGINEAFTVTNNPSVNFIMVKEDAGVHYSGALYISTAAANNGSATVTLKATVRDITAEKGSALYDAYEGDIRNATATFINRETNTVIAANVPLVLATSGDTKNAIASYNWNVNIGNANSQTYTVGIIVNNYYTRNSSADNAVITVSKPLDNFITGGGNLLLNNSSGIVAGDAGSLNDFGFSLKWNNSKSNIQGYLNTIIRRTENGVEKVYQVKANSMTSMVVDNKVTASHPYPTATFGAKANIQDITNPLSPVSVDGNATLQVNMTDASFDGSTDKIALTVWNKNGSLWYSSNWTGASAEQMLNAGNTVINGTTSSASIASRTNVTKEQELAAEETFDIQVYPNPSSQQFNLRVKGGGLEKIEIVVISVEGRQIKKITAIAGNSVIFGNDLNAGVYFVKITQGKKSKVVKVIKR